MGSKRCFAWLLSAGFLVVLPTCPCFAQMGVDSGLGLRLQKANCNFNLGYWRSGAAPTGVLIRETGNLLGGVAPFVAPTINAISSLTNPLGGGGGGDESGGRDDEEFVVEDYDPNFDTRQALLEKIEERQNSLMAKLGIKDFKRQIASVQPSDLPSSNAKDGVGNGLTNPLNP